MILTEDIKKVLDTFDIQNYHKHSDLTNPIITDSPVKLEAYAKRCKEIGSKVLSSVEHGYQGNQWLTRMLADKYDLKAIFGSEAYWVKDRKLEDGSNCHIILLAKNENGRQDINEVLSIANEDGFYRQARIDLDLIMNKLTPSDVFITSSCLAGWKYEDAEDIWVQIHKRFGDNFMLEVQYHNSDEQKELNKRIIRLAQEHNIKIIAGLDSHYIYEHQKVDRDDLLLSRGLKYQESEFETEWYMDMPDKYTCYERFVKQGVLTHEQIIEAMRNTNVLLEFEDIKFDKSLKLPTLFPDKTQEEKDRMYKEIISKEWNKYKLNVPSILHPKYIKEIMKEVTTVINTKMADYFLLDYYLVKEAKKRGGRITLTGRGSGSSYFTNTLLGFSNIDRVVSPVTLYAERFIAEERILKSGSAPD